MVWNLFSKNKVETDGRIKYIEGICKLFKKSMIDNATYSRKLEKNLYDYKTNSNTIFRETCNDDDTCPICLNKLVGHCTTFACDCNITVHESCMFKYMLSGFTKCPICDLTMSLNKYKPTIKYTPIINKDVIIDQYKKIDINKKTSKDAIEYIEKNGFITNDRTLKQIYRDF